MADFVLHLPPQAGQNNKNRALGLTSKILIKKLKSPAILGAYKYNFVYLHI
jgi:hypothetical protein